MHRMVVDMTGKRVGNLTVISLTDLALGNRRSAVWECRCDCGNICYKTGDDLRDTRRKTWSCGCLNRGRKQFPNKFVSKDNNKADKLTRICKKYSVVDLLTAAIMKNNELPYAKAKAVAEKINVDNIFNEIKDLTEE